MRNGAGRVAKSNSSASPAWMKQLAHLRVVALQPSDDVAVDLHHMQSIQYFQQRAGQRAQARPDLDHIVFRFGTDGRNDFIDDLLIDKKILAKTFACFMQSNYLIYRFGAGSYAQRVMP